MTLVNALGACSNLKALEEGRKIHARLSSSGIQSDFSASALVNMYSRAGSLEEARDAFRSRKNRNAICWTAMLAAYAQHGHNHDALRLYKEMDLEGLRPDDVTHAAVLGACACLGALAEGRRVHRRILSTRSSSGLDVVLGTATVNMYAKCGRVDEAKLAFDGISDKSVFCWTAMVGAYARNGHGEKAVELFREMVESSRTLPNDVTFTTVLNACSHAGLVDEGKYFFALMDKVYGIAPSGEHYGCMIDLLGRAGRLEEAERMITGMPFPADKISWETLLGACKLHGDIGRGARVAEQALRMDPENAANYVILSDLYFARGETNMN
ncbi:hypothetical protein SELMODRAFT_80365 [Selaginella moellendorffii]|uniref:Pentacotripeptide-repeat region of PRORP domain-containing protein n=2 Tax=Selaginella moellendorffii TaxID=88036 RepID=D8QYA8_SELML|nr:hypothetical protein SELMODRAFT_80365 [Selaginella moellendorffii]